MALHTAPSSDGGPTQPVSQSAHRQTGRGVGPSSGRAIDWASQRASAWRRITISGSVAHAHTQMRVYVDG